ncbi:MAG TPA: hypothetical protein VGE52_13065 [Pirellulales bacterium]
MPSYLSSGLAYPLPEQLGLVSPWLPLRLTYVSTTLLKLQMVCGGYLRNPLNGEVCNMTSEPTCNTGGLSANTLYYAYLDTGFATPGQFTLETTAPTTQLGWLYKTGDVGSLLVGSVYVVSGVQFRDTVTQRNVTSLYNARKRSMIAFGASQSGITANGAWQTPTNALNLEHVKHPWNATSYWLNHFTSHGTATNETRSGIDIGASPGTPLVYGYGIRSSGSTAYMVSANPPYVNDSDGASWVFEQARCRVWGESSGTMAIVGGAANYLLAECWG